MARGAGARKRRTARRTAAQARQRGARRPDLEVVASVEPDTLTAEEHALAEVGDDADLAVLAVARAMWEERVIPAEIEELAAAAGDLVWDDEDGFMDLMDDLCSLLGHGWRIIDVALSADKAIACCWSQQSMPEMDEEYDLDAEGPGYFLVPFTIGADKEPVLSDQAKWVKVEEGWVKSAAALGTLFVEHLAVMAPCAECSHPAGMHADTSDGDNMGACSVSGCSCGGYEAKSSTAATSEAFTPEQLDAAAAVLAGADGDPETIRVRLEEFTVHFADIALPDEHKPGDRQPRRRATATTPTPPAGAGPSSSAVPWSAILAPEGKLTSDKRAFAPGSIGWPRLDDGPLALMAMTVTSEGGHVGAELSGQIQRIWRDEQAGLIRASGVFDTGDYGEEIARLVDDRTLRGVSVDLAVQRWDRAHVSDYFDEDGNWAPKDEADRMPVTPADLLYGDNMISVVLEAEIGAVTVCPFPAFGEAQIAVGDSLVASSQSEMCWTVTQQAGWLIEAENPETLLASVCGCEDVLTASAEGLVPEVPPASWFADPELEEATALTVDDDGRVFGHAALWNVCHIGLPGTCRTAPHSATDYRHFHLGEVVCEDGERIACGQITLDTGHAARGLDARQATSHYDHTGTVIAHVRVGEDEHGIWVAGALHSDAPADKVRLLRGAKLSGDWRTIEGNLELVALLTVNVPGFPVPRAAAQITASAEGDSEAFSLVAAGVPFLDDELTPEQREQFKALAAEAEFAELADA